MIRVLALRLRDLGFKTTSDHSLNLLNLFLVQFLNFSISQLHLWPCDSSGQLGFSTAVVECSLLS